LDSPYPSSVHMVGNEEEKTEYIQPCSGHLPC
jgi:hypothetical protein